jgi:hypothetical protein
MDVQKVLKMLYKTIHNSCVLFTAIKTNNIHIIIELFKDDRVKSSL